MANKKHVARLKQGVEAWNQWRRMNPKIRPNLSRADLIRASLRGADLRRTNLGKADLTRIPQMDRCATFSARRICQPGRQLRRPDKAQSPGVQRVKAKRAAP